MSNLNSVWAEFDADENQISEFKKRQEIKVTTNAYSNKEFDATVSFIDPVLNTPTRTVTVRASREKDEGIFKPIMFAGVVFSPFRQTPLRKYSRKWQYPCHYWARGGIF